LQDLAWVPGSDDKYDYQQAIAGIKNGKYTDSAGQEHLIYSPLEKFAEHFTKLAELVKLYD